MLCVINAKKIKNKNKTKHLKQKYYKQRCMVRQRCMVLEFFSEFSEIIFEGNKCEYLFGRSEWLKNENVWLSAEYVTGWDHCSIKITF